MIQCQITLDVSRPPAEVFAFIDDVSKAPLWLSRCAEIQQTSAGPKNVGTTLHYRYKEGTGPGAMEGVVRAYEKDRRLVMDFTDKMFDVEVGFELEPIGSGTRIEHTVGITPKAFMAKLMSPMIQAATRQQIAKDTATLKTLLEGGG